VAAVEPKWCVPVHRQRRSGLTAFPEQAGRMDFLDWLLEGDLAIR
jgi:hypothetical protein